MGRRSAKDIVVERLQILQWRKKNAIVLQGLSGVTEAMKIVEEGEFSVLAVCNLLGVNRSSYYRGVEAKKFGRDVGIRGRPTLLREDQELELKETILEANKSGCPITIAELNELASELASKNRKNASGFFDPITVSYNWHIAFAKRHPELVLSIGKPISFLRHDNATTEIISAWFNNVLLPLSNEHQYRREMIANADETMVRLQSPGRAKIIIPRLNGYNRIPQLPEGQHITFLVTVFANGTHVPTQIIFPSKSLPKEMTLEDIRDDPNFVLAGGPKGWITKEIFENYCLEVVIPAFIQRRKDYNHNSRGLFIIDGHASRWNPKLMETFAENEIDVVTLVAHTSHVIQPLDHLVFHLFKKELPRSIRSVVRSFLSDYEPKKYGAEEDSEEEEEDPDKMDAKQSILNESQLTDPLEPIIVVPPTKSTTFKLKTMSNDARRFCLIKAAKHALHIALFREYIVKSFIATGISPVDLNRALSRDGVRSVSDAEHYHNNLDINKKRRRESLNGIVLTRSSSIEMLHEAAKKTAPLGRVKKRTDGKPTRKKRVKNIEYDTDEISDE